MKRADGNSRILRSTGEKKDAHDMNRRIEEVLRRDRASLAGMHNPERARGRAMGLLAAGTVPAAEAAGTGSGFLSRLAGTKGMIGAVALLAGGVSLAVIFTSPEPADPAPAIAPAREVPLPQSRTNAPQWRENAEPVTEPVFPDTDVREVREEKGEERQKNAEGKEGVKAAEPSAPDAPPPDEPGIEERNAARTELQVTPVITNGK